MRKATANRNKSTGGESKDLRATFVVSRDLADAFRHLAAKRERTFSSELRALMVRELEAEGMFDGERRSGGDRRAA